MTLQENKKIMEHESDCELVHLEWSPKELVKGLEDLEIREQDDRIIKIGQNSEKSPGDLKRLAVTQTSANSCLKNSQRSKIIIWWNHW